MKPAWSQFFKTYGHGLFGLYIFIYLPWFAFLETRTNVTYHEIHCVLDDYIPFVEGFIIPYYLWFFFIAITCVTMFYKSQRGEFFRFAIMLTLGMSICNIIYTIYPSYIALRPAILHDTNVFTHTLIKLYNIDTSSNVCPSIHVYNSLVCCSALQRNIYLQDMKSFRYTGVILTALITLSTVFLKQHSFVDVVAAIVLFLIMHYLLKYLPWKILHDPSPVLPPRAK
ncbi:MAG: phosphatase PAP2 family protein [Lachnospiraceae bacterium]|nr:phosphatase PAP2 family protein [Lachnospiraceae bacterium]